MLRLKSMMFFSHSKNSKDRLIIDIEDSGVSCAVVHFDTTIEVFRYEQTMLSVEERKPAQRMTAILQALKTTLGRLSTSLDTIESTEVVIGVPYVVTRFVHTRDVLNHPMLITKEGIRSFSKAVLKEPAEENNRIIARSVTRTLLNGYPTEHPEQKNASIVELDVLECEAEEEVLQKIEKTLQELSVPSKIAFHAKVFPLAKLINSLGRDGCLIDVGATSSQLLVVHHAMLQQAQPLPWGYNKLLSILNDQSPETARALLETFSDGDAPAGNLLEVLASHESSLVSTFGEFFAAIASPHKMPNTLWLLVPTALEKWAPAFFSRIDFSQFTRTSKPFVTNLVPGNLLLANPEIRGTNVPGLLLAIHAVYNTYFETGNGIQSKHL